VAAGVSVTRHGARVRISLAEIEQYRLPAPTIIKR
jgi:hypothetical protein